jgi:hypothetical protein
VRSRATVVVLLLLGVAGVVALGFMAAGGAQPYWKWGYIAATLSFLLSAVQMAPVLSMATRVGRGYWGARLRRVSDVLGLGGLLSAPVLILLLLQLPSWRGRPSIWFDWPGAPLLPDAIAGIGLAFAGAALVWVVTWPERRGPHWAGSSGQWRVLTRATVGLGTLYTLLVVFLHLLIVSDLAMSLVPAWHSAVIPPYHVVSGLQAAVALVLLGVAASGALDSRLSRSSAKLLLALSLLWFYFIWCELLTYWYGGTPDEQSLLQLFMFGPAAGLFLAATVCEFVIPMTVLIWNGARGSPTIISLVAAIVVVGSFLDRLRLFLPAWAVATERPEEHLPQTLPPLPLPGLTEVVACGGLLAITAVLVMVVGRRFSAVSDWEVKAVDRLTPERPVLRTRTVVVARPG